jgi:hypothetical protein
VEAEIRPSALVRQGDSVEFLARLDGPGSVASSSSPLSAESLRLGPGERIESASEDASIDPSSRTFRARIRTTRPGVRTLPPIRVSWFDPASGTFQTAVSRAIKLTVVATPEFDVASLSMPGTPTPRRTWFFPAAGVAVSCLVVSATILAVLRWRLARLRREEPRTMAARLAALIRSADGPRSAATAATQGLIALLHRLGGREEGAITPEEARAWLLRTTADEGLADRAESLIASCDRVLYGEESEAIDLRDRAVDVLSDLARSYRPTVARETSGAA